MRAVEQEGDARHDDAGAAAQQRRGDGDDDQVEQRERAGGAAQVIDQAGDQDEVADELDVGLGGGGAPQHPDQGDVEEGGREGGAAEQPDDAAARLQLGGRGRGWVWVRRGGRAAQGRLARPAARPAAARAGSRPKGSSTLTIATTRMAMYQRS